MTDTEMLRQQRLAEHYLISDASSLRLRETIVLAATAVGFPHAQINVLDDTTQYTICDYRAGGRATVPRTETMCHFTVDAGGILSVDDLRIDDRFHRIPGVAAGRASSYLGVALRSRESTPIGTLCFFDSEPRHITSEQRERTLQFGHIVEDQLELMRRAREHRLPDRVAAADLAEAVRRAQIVPWFQPVVELATDRVVGYEALARWERPGLSTEDPATFVPLAEDSDLVVDMDRVVMRQALARFASWDRPGLRLNVNLSTRHLEIPDGVSDVHEAVLAAGLRPQDVGLELTETRELTHERTARDAVSRLRELGYHVLLDDFGSGWSSLEWILRLPVTGIKVDRAVTSALGSPAGDAVTRAVIAMTDELRLGVVVEGIESLEHVHLARSHGYRYGQGYFWTPPLPPAQIEAQGW